MEQTLVICKPDAVERRLTGEIVGRMEAKGFRLAAAELRIIDVATAEHHYGEHQDKPFFADLVAFITRGPSLLMVVEGPEGTIAMVRKLMGATNPATAEVGTIRGDLATETSENLVHGSDSADAASREIHLFFPSL
ncbi:MAG: nucleoside-diphosphate kinase [Acidimicrobiia bacterium]|nr:nucleoside-diphosphate kinase [Acidimicrobiia bacterium]